MTEPDDLAPEEKRIEELLLRSAKLDVPNGVAKQRFLDAGLSALNERRGRRRATVVLGTALALAAGVALFVVARGGDEGARAVAPERPRAAPGDVRSAVPAQPAPVPSRQACPELVVARGNAPLIEDWETHDSLAARLDGRSGNWATYDDGTGKQAVPDRSPLFPSRIQSRRGSSTRALHMTGGVFKKWGVTFGAELADAACYDASAYAGFEFWAKGPGRIKVGLQMIDVQDEKYGGFCRKDCYNAHRKVVELSKTWNRYVVRWEELAQLYKAGPPLDFDPKRVRFLEFSLGPESTPFDFWIDDVAFLKR